MKFIKVENHGRGLLSGFYHPATVPHGSPVLEGKLPDPKSKVMDKDFLFAYGAAVGKGRRLLIQVDEESGLFKGWMTPLTEEENVLA